MPKSKMFRPVQVGKKKRYTYARSQEVLKMPHLLDLQTKSYEWFCREGLKDVFADISPIEDSAHKWALHFGDYYFGQGKYNIEQCKAKDVNYSAPLYVKVRLENKETGELKEHDLFMGDFPVMTDTGTFIINGAERVIVSQLVRSPGVYYKKERDAFDKEIYSAQLIPNRGAWIELESDPSGSLSVRIDRNRKMPVTVLIRVLGYSTNEEILELFDHDIHIEKTLEKDSTTDRKSALIEIYHKLRPGEPATEESGATLLHNFFFDPRRYDLAKVGRYKLNKKLSWRNRLLGHKTEGPIVNMETGEVVIEANSIIDDEAIAKIEESGVFNGNGQVEIMTQKDDGTPVKVICSSGNREDNFRTLENCDIIACIDYLLNMMQGYGKSDDIDHLGNRRVRCVGELLQNQFRIGLTRMERVVRERMTTQDQDKMTPQALVNIRPVVAAIKEFFGSSQLSQFMDQNNPLAELTHKRRLSALGPGGLSRDRAGFEVRDVHYSHYGRMCPIETPEGPNIGLISYLASYAKINEYGFVEAPYRKVKKIYDENGNLKEQVVTDEVEYMTADVEDEYVVAQANEPLDEGKHFIRPRVSARRRDEILEIDAEKVDYMDVSPRMMVSVATACIPFLENDDCNRALMGSNMQRQAVPLMVTQQPIVATGMEYKAATDSGTAVLAKNDGIVEKMDADHVVVRNNKGELEDYPLVKFARSNAGTCINQRPIVEVGESVKAGQVLADGPAMRNGEISLGKNALIGFMTWEGYNYEDAVLLNEKIVREDVYTSIHIEEYETESRDTKLGPEEITRDIPNVSEDALKDLDERGIIRIGAEVKSGDILVGKVTPKGETELTAEERLLRAIFGAKAHDVRDTSLKMPHGAYGRVIDVVRFSRENGDDLAPGVNEQVRVYVAQRRKIQQGDKIAGRHGNKGVICNVLPVEDMPYMADGTPIDVILNPLGVPSRMNVGQLLECHLGWAAACGWDTEDADSDKYVPGPFFVSTPVFDGAKEDEIAEVIRRANKNMLNKATAAFGDHMRPEFVTQLDERGKTRLFDGRTGEEFREPITVGTSYILKLGHMVDDKIHARSTGPYSLVTQQPLGGKAQFGGQRFGEMEVWALYAYGAANVLQEILTVKSDDTVGRVKTYESIVKGENVPVPGIPESFKVLVKEIRSLALDIEPMHDADEDASAPVTAEETSALDDLAALAGVDTDVEAQDAETAEAPEAVAATTTDKE